MPETDTELEIPAAAAEAGAEALAGYQIADSDLLDAAWEVLQAAGPALVSEELRRMAALLDETDDARKLIARANELDPDDNYREG